MRRGFERRPLAAAVVFTVMGVLPLYLTSAQSVAIQRDLGFGPSRFGLVVSTFFLISSVAAKRVGPRIDRDGPTRGLRLAAILTLVTAVAIAVGVRGWPTLALALGLSGLGNAYGQVASNAVIAHLVRTRRQAVSFSAKQSAVPLSAMVSGAVVPVVGPGGHWRWAYVAVGVLAAVLLTSLPSFVTPSTAAARDAAAGVTDPETPTGRRITPALVLLMAAAALAGGTGNATAAFTPDAAVAAGFSASVAALLLTAGSLVAIVVRISAGLSADRRAGSGAAETALLLTVGIGGLTVLATAGSSSTGFLVGLLLAFAGAWGWQGVIAMMALRTIELPAATSTGAVWAGVYLGTVIVPAVVGVVVEQASYAVVFAGQAVLMAIATACVVASRLLSRRRTPDPAPG